MKNKKILFVILIFGIFLIVGCTTQTQTTNIENNAQKEVQLTGQTKEIEITARNWEFTPNTIEVNLGDRVELHIESVEGTHGFMLSEFGINERLVPYQDVHVNFIADKKGTFPFSCSVPCGSGHGGMTGQLIVK